jgi:ATP-binding cassette subfamily A (ABC1) protein 3
VRLADDQDGSEKKTTFKILTGDELITSGDIWIKKNSSKIQFDYFLSELTGGEILKISAISSGYKFSQINELLNKIAVDLNFQVQLNKKVKFYNNQDRKRLISALSKLGYPDVIFLNVRMIF